MVEQGPESLKPVVSLPFSSSISRSQPADVPAQHPRRLVALQTHAADALKGLANALIALVRWCFWPGRRPLAAQNVCIYRIGNLGDVLCALPAMQAIRDAYPQARLTLLTSAGKRGMPGARELLNGAPWLDELIVYHLEDMATRRQRLNYFQGLRRRKFDVWIELSPNLITLRVVFRNMLAARLAGPRWAGGWTFSTIRWAARAQSEYKIVPNEVTRLVRVMERCGIRTAEPRFPLPLTGQHALAVDAALKDFVPPGTAPVAIAPGAKRPTNRWPLERYAEVARALAEQGFFVLFLGGPGEQEACQDMASRMGSRALSLAGRLSPLESCEALRRCAFVVCNDSGVQHMAAAVSTPCVSIFSRQDQRGKWRPYGSQHIVLQKDVPCHTCFLKECPHDNLCVKRVEVSEVLEATRILAERKQAGRY
jgi:ADP-heptose:LPS heptosyltransferase